MKHLLAQPFPLAQLVIDIVFVFVSVLLSLNTMKLVPTWRQPLSTLPICSASSSASSDPAAATYPPLDKPLGFLIDSYFDISH